MYIISVFLSDVTTMFYFFHRIKVDHLQPVTCFVIFFVAAVSYHFQPVLCIDYSVSATLLCRGSVLRMTNKIKVDINRQHALPGWNLVFREVLSRQLYFAGIVLDIPGVLDQQD